MESRRADTGTAREEVAVAVAAGVCRCRCRVGSQGCAKVTVTRKVNTGLGPHSLDGAAAQGQPASQSRDQRRMCAGRLMRRPRECRAICRLQVHAEISNRKQAGKGLGMRLGERKGCRKRWALGAGLCLLTSPRERGSRCSRATSARHAPLRVPTLDKAAVLGHRRPICCQ